MVNKQEQKFLIQLAKNSIIDNGKLNSNNIPNALKEKKGIFVSLYVNNELRGCIGSLLPSDSIFKSVIKNAINAAYHDYRFPPLTKNDFNSLKIEISVLSDPVRLHIIDFNHLLKKLNEEEGLILKKGQQMATFLPQVWQQINDKTEFLRHLCFKAHLDEDAWKDSDVEVYAYNVKKFSG